MMIKKFKRRLMNGTRLFVRYVKHIHLQYNFYKFIFDHFIIKNIGLYSIIMHALLNIFNIYINNSNVCLLHRPLFIHEQKLFTPETLRLHNEGRLKDDDLKGHPQFFIYSFIYLFII